MAEMVIVMTGFVLYTTEFLQLKSMRSPLIALVLFLNQFVFAWVVWYVSFFLIFKVSMYGVRLGRVCNQLCYPVSFVIKKE